MLFTAGIASAKYFFKHVSRQNTLTQARRNISRHYDLVIGSTKTTHFLPFVPSNQENSMKMEENRDRAGYDHYVVCAEQRTFFIVPGRDNDILLRDIQGQIPQLLFYKRTI